MKKENIGKKSIRKKSKTGSRKNTPHFQPAFCLPFQHCKVQVLCRTYLDNTLDEGILSNPSGNRILHDVMAWQHLNVAMNGTSDPIQ